MAVPNTSIANHMHSGGEIVDCVYTAPEMWRDGGSEDVIRLTKESDVYGMGMVVYEVSSAVPCSLAQGLDLILSPRSWQGTRRTPSARMIAKH